MMLLAAVAFAAFCVWLAVRLVNRRERWTKWTAVAWTAGVLLSAGYVGVYRQLILVVPTWTDGAKSVYGPPTYIQVAYIGPPCQGSIAIL